MVDGSNLVMTDVSAEVAHEDRQILVRESRTGILRDADQTERDRRIEMYYPSKHTSIQIPRYIDVDHSQIEQDWSFTDTSDTLPLIINQLGSTRLIVVIDKCLSSFETGYGNSNRTTWRIWAHSNNGNGCCVLSTWWWKGIIWSLKKHFKKHFQYYRLRMKLNDLIISKSRFDDFYASRHFGQFIIYVSNFFSGFDQSPTGILVIRMFRC